MTTAAPVQLGNLIFPPWYKVARAELGQHEIAGGADNLRVLEYQHATRKRNAITHDSDPWCSDFANWCMQEVGLSGSGAANARSWLEWGEAIKLPKIGCVVVFAAPLRGPTRGHVGFFASQAADARTVRVLGGNQHNSVCEASYLATDLLGYRWPTAAALEKLSRAPMEGEPPAPPAGE